MKYHYKALFSEPGNADLVYAKLKQQFPEMEIHISESDYPQKNHSHSIGQQRIRDNNTRGFHNAHDTEFGTDVSFTMLAPLTFTNRTPSDVINQNNTGVTPSPYGAITALINDAANDKVPKPEICAVVYGSCDASRKSSVTQNLRRYGADSVMTSTQDF